MSDVIDIKNKIQTEKEHAVKIEIELQRYIFLTRLLVMYGAIEQMGLDMVRGSQCSLVQLEAFIHVQAEELMKLECVVLSQKNDTEYKYIFTQQFYQAVVATVFFTKNVEPFVCEDFRQKFGHVQQYGANILAFMHLEIRRNGPTVLQKNCVIYAAVAPYL